VLSTLHTNDAPSTINRLMNMGIEPFLVASSVNLICAQRLVRRICAHCKEDHPTPPPALVEAGFTQEESQTVVPKRGKGCNTCNSTGYKGRVGLYEVMEISDEQRAPEGDRGGHDDRGSGPRNGEMRRRKLEVRSQKLEHGHAERCNGCNSEWVKRVNREPERLSSSPLSVFLLLTSYF
jgi:type II secretory ATPase GspE/PulE/Tfp pilus assembly ATPase PilB-like protein